MDNLEFCYHLAYGVRHEIKNLTLKPVHPSRQIRMDSAPPPPPFQVGQIVPVKEPWRMTPHGIELAAALATSAPTFDDPPRGFRPASTMPLEYAQLRVRITEVTLIKASSLTEEDAQRCGTIPHDGTYRDEFIRQWSATYTGALAWGVDPWCWRIAFALVPISG